MKNSYNIIIDGDVLIGYARDLMAYTKAEISRMIGDDSIAAEDVADAVQALRDLAHFDGCTLLRVEPSTMGGVTIYTLHAEWRG